MWHEIAAWQEKLNFRPDLSTKTVALYTQDARRFAIWLQHEHPGLKVTEVTPTDAKTYRDYLLAKRYAPPRPSIVRSSASCSFSIRLMGPIPFAI